MRAAIVSVGDELTSGLTVDTNSAWLARKLGERGILVAVQMTVPDDKSAIARTLSSAAGQAELVIVTGGLGPTADDLTREALADVLGSPLTPDKPSIDRIEGFFRARGRRMVESNRRQAMIPEGAEAIANELGTAPGIEARLGGARVFVLPGVPSEMKDMFGRCVLPRLTGEAVLLHRTLHTFGSGESDIGTAIADLMAPGRSVHVGTTASSGLVSIRLYCRGETPSQTRELIDETCSEIHRRLGELVIGEDDFSMAEAVGGMLRAHGQTLATAESCTGGMVGQMITAVAGSSEYYLGGVVAYSNELKQELLGVPAETIETSGAVSAETAKAMALGARDRLGTDWAVSLTGIAGPGGGTAEKPVGLVFTGLAGPDGVDSERHVMPGTRDMVRLRAALASLNGLRLAVRRRASS